MKGNEVLVSWFLYKSPSPLQLWCKNTSKVGSGVLVHSHNANLIGTIASILSRHGSVAEPNRSEFKSRLCNQPTMHSGSGHRLPVVAVRWHA